MNIFDSHVEIKLRHIIGIGWLYSRIYYMLLVIISLLIGLFPAIIISLQTQFIDLASHNNDLAVSIFASMFIIYFLINLMDMNSKNAIGYLNFKISNKIEKKIMGDYLNKIAAIRYEDYENSNTQDLIYRIKVSIKDITDQGVRFFPNILINLISLSGIFYYIILSGVWWVIPISVLLSLPSFHFNKKRVEYARKVWEKDSEDIRYSEYLHTIIVNRESAKERKLFQFVEYVASKWEDIFKRYNRKKIINYSKSSIATGIAMCFSMSNIIIFGVALLFPLKDNVITIGLYVSLIQMIITKFNYNINAFIREVTDAVKLNKFVKDVSDFKGAQFINNIGDDGDEIIFENLRFDDVYFKYPNTENYVLKGVSFEIRKGCHYALIGMNGAGKTTITKLMLGLYKPTSGKILINDIEISKYSYSQLRTIYVCIQQELVKYKTTARKNIGLYRLKDSESNHNIDGVLLDNHLYGLKDKLVHGYDTLLTPELENGVELSGGEWQKIALARALFAQKSFCILDEPTAALDPHAEAVFYRDFKALMKDSTCFYITHRLGSTFLFEKCLVLNDGVIEEMGSHEELIQNPNGLYKALYEKQKAWYESEGKFDEGNQTIME